ncbi:MAG: J domain-containing protein [Desulfobacterales bacterium]|nr:J domain-containing protein [Desulfobacterales bacterium]
MNDRFSEDLYESLQISSNADLETIERVYRLLAKKYHPDNDATGNNVKFQKITNAYKILSSPEKRAAYDVNYERATYQRWKTVSNTHTTEEFGTDKQIRYTILSVLYIKRREAPSEAGVGIWHLEQLLEWPEITLDFHLWYLKEKSWIVRADSGGFEITAEGIDEIEKNGLIRGKDLLLPESTQSPEKENVNLMPS